MRLLLFTDDAKKGSQYYQRVSCARCAAARLVSLPTRIARGHRHLCCCPWFYRALFSDDDEFAFLFAAAVDIVVAALNFLPFAFVFLSCHVPPLPCSSLAILDLFSAGIANVTHHVMSPFIYSLPSSPRTLLQLPPVISCVPSLAPPATSRSCLQVNGTYDPSKAHH